MSLPCIASLLDTLLEHSILRNFHEKWSGGIYLIFELNVFIYDFDGLMVRQLTVRPGGMTPLYGNFVGAGLQSEG